MCSVSQAVSGQARGPRPGNSVRVRLLVLRASHASVDIGSADVRIWSELDLHRFECVLLLQSKRGSSERRQGNVKTVVTFVPRIPLVSWFLLNLLIVLRFSDAQFDLTVCTPRTWLAAAVLRRRGAANRLIMDVRSGPAHRRWFLRALEHAEVKVALALGHSDGLTFINEATRDLLLGTPPEVPVGIWGSGVDLNLFRPVEKERGALRQRLGVEGSQVVLYHGTITTDRGVSQLVRAVERLRKRGTNVKLLLLGWGPDLGRLRREFAPLIRSQILILQPPVAYEQVPAYVGACDVGALPFPRDPKWETQMPLKLLEFIAMEKLVVATDLKAHRGFGRGVALVPDNHPETLARELERLFQIPQAEREARLEDSRARVEKLSWGDQARALQAFIDMVLSGSQGHA